MTEIKIINAMELEQVNGGISFDDVKKGMDENVLFFPNPLIITDARKRDPLFPGMPELG